MVNINAWQSTTIGLSLCLLATGLGCTNQSTATSRGYSAPAQVILKDGTPCFFATMADDKPTPAGQTLTIKNNRGTTTAWQIDDEHGTEALPASAERCVKYGTSWRTGVTATAPTPLQYDVPYYADIETKVRFRVEFCLSQDVGGKAFLTKWAEDGNHCTRLPLKGPD